MAKYRQVHSAFWGDRKIIDMTPEDKFFYLYLLTNPNTTQCGIYELSVKIMEAHTGYNRDTVNSLLKRFQEVHRRIFYNSDTGEICIVNWLKYNVLNGKNINNPKVIKCIETEFSSVVDKSLIGRLVGIEKLNIPYAYPIDTPCIDRGEEREEEKEKEKEREEEKEPQNTLLSDSEEIWTIYPLKQGKADAMKKLPKLLKQYSKEQFMAAIKRYIADVEKQRKTGFKELRYVNGSTFFNGRYMDYISTDEPVEKVGESYGLEIL